MNKEIIKGIRLGALICIVLSIIMIGMVSAETETYKVNEEINLILTCTTNNAIPSASATMNLTVAYPNGTIFLNAVQANQLGSGIFNYTITFPIIGNYHPTLLCVDGSNSNSDSSGTYIITSTGQDGSMFYIILITSLAIIFLIVTLFVDEEFFVYISGVLFLVGGIYLMINGLDVLNDTNTRYLSYIYLGIGMLFTLGAYIYNHYSRGESEEEY